MTSNLSPTDFMGQRKTIAATFRFAVQRMNCQIKSPASEPGQFILIDVWQKYRSSSLTKRNSISQGSSTSSNEKPGRCSFGMGSHYQAEHYITH
jgi:hypothetical protein